MRLLFWPFRYVLAHTRRHFRRVHSVNVILGCEIPRYPTQSGKEGHAATLSG